MTTGKYRASVAWAKRSVPMGQNHEAPDPQLGSGAQLPATIVTSLGRDPTGDQGDGGGQYREDCRHRNLTGGRGWGPARRSTLWAQLE